MTGQAELMELMELKDLRCSQGESRPPEGLAQLQGSRPREPVEARGRPGGGGKSAATEAAAIEARRWPSQPLYCTVRPQSRLVTTFLASHLTSATT